MSGCRDIKAVKKAIVRYEQIAETKINFDKSEGLQLGDWRSGVSLPRPFRWINGPVHILGVWFGPVLQMEQNWSEVQVKVDAHVGIWLQKQFSLRGRVELCALYIFLMILYRFSVLPLPENHRLAFQRPKADGSYTSLLSTSA